MWKKLLSRSLVALSLFGASFALPALAGDTSSYTEIASLPYFISTSGNYCLRKNLSISAGPQAIQVSASNVTVDLNGYTLQGTGAVLASDSSCGIYVAKGTGMVNVQNGTITGFSTGVCYADVAGGIIESLSVQDCSSTGIGINGRGIVIRRNRILNINANWNPSGNGYATGITVAGNGEGAHILDNDIMDTISIPSRGLATGIWVVATGTVIQNNRVTNMAQPLDRCLCFHYGGKHVLIWDNHFYNAKAVFNSLAPDAANIFRGNSFASVPPPSSTAGLIDAGNNTIH